MGRLACLGVIPSSAPEDLGHLGRMFLTETILKPQSPVTNTFYMAIEYTDTQNTREPSFLFFFETEFHSFCPGWSPMARSRITATPPGFNWDYKHVPPCSANFVFLVETGFLHVGQAVLELPTSGDSPASASQSAGIPGVNHCAWPTKVSLP
uniref:Uncharacterized protein n=1 Tax=Gorilla gorilla gorilla TaxID=9595 RepID=A0A2I2YFD2_GORGO